jgi:hypothetical protein
MAISNSHKNDDDNYRPDDALLPMASPHKDSFCHDFSNRFTGEGYHVLDLNKKTKPPR